MTNESAPHSPVIDPPPPDHRPDPDAVGPIRALDLLIDEARATVEDQIALAKSFAAAAGTTARSVAIFSAAALLLALVALMAMAVGMTLSLAPYVGTPLATLVVAGALLIGAGIAALAVRRAVRRFQDAASGINPQ